MGGSAPREYGAPYWMESALWEAAGVPSLVFGPAGGSLHAIDEWVDLNQVRRYPVALSGAITRLLT
jgi:Acetylornithine deacetylase/Succinyl-diaminopimelate desuccinylase and related deacylases